MPLDSSQFRSVKQAYLELSSLGKAGRDRALADLERYDVTLRQAVVSLLAHDVTAEARIVWRSPADDGPEPLTGTRFEDCGRLGVGGMGEVRRVYDPKFGKVMALKYLRTRHHRAPSSVREGYERRFAEEVVIQASLRHVAIPAVHEHGRLIDGRPYVVMTAMSGERFDHALDSLHANSVGAADGLFADLVGGLQRVARVVAYAHRAGVVHRDLKPQNILARGRRVAVLDWGLAARYPGEDATHAEPSKTVSGTPGFLSPEQARGERGDARSDVFALGAILYRVLSGRDPYEGPDALEQVRRGPPPRPVGRSEGPDPGPRLVAICNRAMSFAPQRRFGSAQAFADALGPWSTGAEGVFARR